ncbi:response regulator transcription factor [Fictibacillus macauensis]|nr:response regulator transcription factor [Fictibacillus macauensis]
MSQTVLIVDDEYKIVEVVASYLQNAGYQTLTAENGEKALAIMQSKSIDFLILDLMLPDISGEEVCRRVRQMHGIPILMLTAKVSEEERIAGLAIGADDYMVKPFSPRELVMRVKTIMRRVSESELLADELMFHDGELVINAVEKEVYITGEVANLTPLEYKVLLVLARHPKRTFTREELVEKVWGFDYEGDARTIDQHVKNLRHKLEHNPKEPRYIVTVFGVGYKFIGSAS